MTRSERPIENRLTPLFAEFVERRIQNRLKYGESDLAYVPEQLFEVSGRPGSTRITRAYYGPARDQDSPSLFEELATASFELKDGVYVPIDVRHYGENYWDRSTLWVNDFRKARCLKPGEIRFDGYQKSAVHPFETLVLVYDTSGRLKHIARNPARLDSEGGSAVLSHEPAHAQITELLNGRSYKFIKEGSSFSYEFDIDEETGEISVKRKDSLSADEIKVLSKLDRESIIDELFDPTLLEEPWTLDTTLDRAWRGASLLRLIGGEWNRIHIDPEIESLD